MGDTHAIIGCKQRESLKDYFDRFTKATLDTSGQYESMVTGTFTWGRLSGELSKKFVGKAPQTRHELKEMVKIYLRQEASTTDKQAILKAIISDKSQ